MLHLLVLLVLLAAAPAEAKLLALRVERVEPAFAGRAFGAAGAYETVTGTAVIGVDPAHPGNAGVADLALAPRGAAGLVEATAPFAILRPADPARASGRLLLDVPNRGNKVALALLNDAPMTNDLRPAEAAGDGFLLERGDSLVWAGWQGDVPAADGRLGLGVPVLAGITGLHREEAVFDDDRDPAVIQLSYPAATMEGASVTLRARQEDPRQAPPGLSLRFPAPDRAEIRRPAGFDAGAIYEVIYRARDPKLLGLGFPALRDLAAFLRHEAAAPDGTPNPLRRPGEAAPQSLVALGVSQSGRVLRDFLRDGFNADEGGRRVFDGLMIHAAGARGSFVNARFALPGRVPTQHEDHLFPGDGFPFAYETATDPLTGRQGGLLEACRATGTCPRVIHTDTDTEVAQGRAWLVGSAPDGSALPEAPEARLYLLAGLPHFVRAGARSESSAVCRLPTNPLPAGAAMRALLVALEGWIGGAAPPASRFPRGEALATPEAAHRALLAIPALAATRPAFNPLHLVEHGPQPPRAGPRYPDRVAALDADGHPREGLRLPPVTAPLATHLGWNPRRPGFAEGALCGTNGSIIPLAATAAERARLGDPRPSLAERYGTREAYVSRVRAAAEALVAERLLLPMDAEAAVGEAGRAWDAPSLPP